MRRFLLLLLCCLLLAGNCLGARCALGYLYSADAVTPTAGSLTEAAPVCISVEIDGNLRLEPLLTAGLVETLHRQGLRVTPLVSNHWDRAAGAAALENAPALAAQLAAAVETYGLDGVQLDLENLTEAHRDGYTALVRQVRAALPPDKTVAVAVAANPKGLTAGWHGSYDLAALADCADYLMLMAYDEHYRGGPPGPVASLAFVEASIRQALTAAPPEKLVLGLPLFGRIWREGGTGLNGQGLGEAQLLELVRRYGGAIRYDAAAGSAVARFTVTRQRGDSVAGLPLTPGRYAAWYADETAKKALLSLAARYGLRGAGAWRLGQEDGGLWDYFTLWLNGLPFADLEGHWAVPDVVAAAEAGWMRGVSDTEFAPDRVLTRAEAAALLCRLLGRPAAGRSRFADVRGHWAAAEIAAVEDLLSGVGEDRFAPEDPVTREQLAALLHRAAGMPAAAGGLSAFADGAQVRAYAREAVIWAAARGILQGAGGRLLPRAGVTRAQAAAMLCRYAALP